MSQKVCRNWSPCIKRKAFDMCLLTPQGNALLGSQFVLAWVLRISNFGPSGHRLIWNHFECPLKRTLYDFFNSQTVQKLENLQAMDREMDIRYQTYYLPATQLIKIKQSCNDAQQYRSTSPHCNSFNLFNLP